MKVVYLAIEQAAKKWSIPIRGWKPALNQFMMLYEDRFPGVFLTAVYTDILTLTDIDRRP
jgi:hypothetical protein